MLAHRSGARPGYQLGRRVLAALAMAALAGLAGPAFAQDVTPPTLASYAVSPPVVDATGGDASLQITAQISDDLSGFENAGVLYASPGLEWFLFVELDASHRTAGDALDGTYETSVVVPEHSKAGTWFVLSFSARDAAGNANTTPPAPASSSFDVLSVEDLGPPTLTSTGASPTSLDVTTGPGSLVLSLQATDDLSGFERADVTFQSPSGLEQVFVSVDASHRISGDALNGGYQRSVEFPQLSEAGAWIVESVLLRDVYGYSDDVQNASLPSPPVVNVSFDPDGVAPSLVSLSVAPTPVSLWNGPRTATFTVHITDDVTGVDTAGALLGSPVEEESKVIVFDAAHRISGDNLDGVYAVDVEFAPGDTLGVWTIEVYANDAANNFFRLSGGALPGPSAFLVTTAPPPPLPVLSPLAVATLVTALAGAGAWGVRRR